MSPAASPRSVSARRLPTVIDSSVRALPHHHGQRRQTRPAGRARPRRPDRRVQRQAIFAPIAAAYDSDELYGWHTTGQMSDDHFITSANNDDHGAQAAARGRSVQQKGDLRMSQPPVRSDHRNHARATNPAPPSPVRGDLTQELIDTDIWTDQMVPRPPASPSSTFPVRHVRRRHRVLRDRRLPAHPRCAAGIRYSPIKTPWESYEYLTRVSQIPRGASDCARTPRRHRTTSGASRATRCGRRWVPSPSRTSLPAVERVHRADPLRLLHPRRQAFESMEREARKDPLPEWSKRAKSGWSGGGGRLLHRLHPAGTARPTRRIASQSIRAHRRRLPRPEVPPRPETYRENYQDTRGS